MMKIYCITMARDEASILPACADQALEFFDEWLFLDHGSVDSGPSYCRERCGDRVEVLRLFASGYPQSEVTTLLTRRAFQEKGADVVVLLDCDEFLPFDTRTQFEQFLAGHQRDGKEVVLMPWLNLVPEKLDGSNIFNGQFHHGEPSERFSKVVLFRELFDRVPSAQLWQGNHGINCGVDAPARTIETPGTPILHIPIRSLTHLALKFANGSRIILNDHACHSRGLGAHWVDLALDCRTRGGSDAWVRQLALGYPDLAPQTALAHARILNFRFPYLRSEYAEAAADTAASILRTLGKQMGWTAPTASMCHTVGR